MSNLSLAELNEIKSKLEKWTNKDREYLGDYRHFYQKKGELYFSLRYPGIHLNAKLIKLNDLWDIKTGNPLSDNYKINIENTCKKIIKMESRLRKVSQDILKFYLGQNFLEQNKKTQSKKNRTSDEERIKQYIEMALKLGDIPKGEKYLDKTMYRKLNDRSFLISLTNIIQKKKNTKYNYSDDNYRLLILLSDYFSARLLRIVEKGDSLRKQPQAIEYSDDYDYNKPYKKKPKSPEY